MTTNTHGGKRAGAGRKPGTQSTANARYYEARAQKEQALARLRKAEADERERHLIPASEVEQAVGIAYGTIAQRLLSLPDELERQHGIEPELAEAIEATIHTMMEGLADALQAVSTTPDTANLPG